MKISHHCYILLVLFCHICGLVLFLRGFFPVKKGLDGVASSKHLPAEPGKQEQGPPFPARFQRLVLMLVDALRADFVFSSVDENTSRKFGKMKYVWQLINSNSTLSFFAKVHPPTVTMPRIKAITTGSIPGFIDIVLNLDSKALQEDNVITQMRAAGKTIVFFGDDTWIKLFPDHFLRHDGTTSFFVTDYTEVDNNVTRHISSEMDKSDWNTMILHYLGLDHIGHTAGPSSPLVAPKLEEMDHIVEEVYKALVRWDQENGGHSLLVLCGDHGMSDSGSHGGASAAETITPLVFLSSMFSGSNGAAFTEQVVEQIDLGPTLALLFGLPIPQNSIGNVIPEVLKFYQPREKLRALQLNAHQLSNVLVANGHDSENTWERLQAYKLHADWLNNYNNQERSGRDVNVQADVVAKQYTVALRKMKSLITASLSNYDLHAMIVGILLIWESFLGVLYGLVQLHGRRTEECSILWSGVVVPVSSAGLFSGINLVLIAIHIGICSSVDIGGSESLCQYRGSSLFFASIFFLFTGIAIAILISLTVQTFDFERCKTFLSPSLTLGSSFLFSFGTVLHTFSLLSSSFVEEEHQTWYFLTLTYFITSFLDKIKQSIYNGKQKDDSLVHFHELKKELANRKGGNKIRKSHLHDIKENNCVNKEILNSNFPHSRTKSRRSLRDSDKIAGDINRPYLPSIFDEYFSKIRQKMNVSTTAMGFQCFGFLHPFAVTSVLLICGRLSRSLNQTGIKWAYRPDIGDWLVKPENKTVLSLTVAVSLLFLSGTEFLRWKSWKKFNFLMFFSGAINIYIYRAVSGSVWLPWLQGKPITKGISEARFVYFCVASLLLKNLVAFRRVVKLQKEEEIENFSSYCDKITSCLDGLRASFLLLLALLLRPHNVTLLVIFVIAEHCITKSTWNQNNSTCWTLPLAALWMGKASFFAQGNSNSIATIDVSAGYVGLEEYVPIIVGLLTFLSTYCGPLLWYCCAIVFIVRHSPNIDRLKWSLVQLCYLYVLHEAFILAVYSVLVFGQRYHLFVWSVFSPKLLYEAAATFFTTTCVIVTVVITRTLSWTSE